MYVNEITSSRRWFHTNIDGLGAESLLLNQGKDGSFLVRPSKKQLGDYALSVRRGQSVTHIRIQNTGECYDLYGGEQFATLTELVQHYTEKSDELEERSGEVIQLRCPLMSADPTTERWLHTQISGKAAEKLLLETGVNGSYLVRESLSKPGDFVLSVRMQERIIHVMIQSRGGKYSVEGCDDFETLSDLIEYNKENPMSETDGSVIILECPLMRQTHINLSRFSVCVSELEADTQEDMKKGFVEEFEALGHQELNELPRRNDGKTVSNRPKNRYRNILPFDFNRVVLEDGDPNVEGSDYINANIITNQDLECGKRPYIATQGCLPSTVTDFWRMVWQHNTRVIIMTSNLVERGKNKCVKYWPEHDETKEMLTFSGLLTVVNRSEATTQDYCVHEFDVSFQSSDPKITPAPLRKVYHFHYRAWPDHGVPSDPGSVLSFLQDMRGKQESIPDAGPVVVHCSAGIGRTGTVLVIDMILQQIKQRGLDCEIDVQKMTLMVRAQRSGMVQTEAQYRFIYMAVRHYIDTTLQRMQAEQESSGGYEKLGRRNNSGHVYENVAQLKTHASSQSPQH